MILHAITVRNWCNIGRVELSDLDHPIVILHGPNRTGKSSLVRAIRSCLLDHDFDSVAAPVRQSVPWATKQTPEVCLEFETGGRRFRLSKRFAKSGDQGEARLELLADGGNWQTAFRGKEVQAETHKLLGLENSRDGLQQLLWLEQGQLALPGADKLEPTLERRFEEVLGSLLTQSDHRFYDRICKACETWFTKAMKEKKDSPLAARQTQLEKAEAARALEQGKYREAEQKHAEYDRGSSDITAAQAEHEEARQEVARLVEEQAHSRERRSRHALARERFERAQHDNKAASDRLAEFTTARQRLSDVATAATLAEAATAASRTSGEQLAAELEMIRARIKTASTRLLELDAQRAELDDRRRLVAIAAESTRLVQKLEKCGELRQRLDQLNAELAGMTAPEKGELDLLRENRRKAEKLRAKLAAGSLRLIVRPTRSVACEEAIDNAAPAPAVFEPGVDFIREFRQRLELRLDFGTVEIRRGEEDGPLDDAAHDLVVLDQAFGDAVRSYSLDVHAHDVLELLAERHLRRLEQTRLAAQLDKELRELAPEGVGVVAAEQSKVEAELQTILGRRPALAAWPPSAEELHFLQQEFDALRAQSQAELTQLEQARAEHERRWTTVDKTLQQQRERLAECRATQAAAEAELKRLGDDFSLRQASQSIHERLRDAERELQETALTDDEQTVDTRLATARNALQLRAERWQTRQKQQDELHFFLRSLEGIHESLVAAEVEVEQCRKELREAQLNADSHKLLRELFESCRDEQVQRTTGVIGDRVLHWSRQLGLHDFEELEFNAGYLPQSVRRSVRESPVPIDQESYGTWEQLCLLIRLAAGGLLAKGQRQATLLDDPLTHADHFRHGRMLQILEAAAAGSEPISAGQPAATPLQILIFTCHPERYDHLVAARRIDLASTIER